MTGDLLHDDSLGLCLITHLVADVGITALPHGLFVRTFGHGHVVDVPRPECIGVLFVTAAPAAWYSELVISTVWRPPSEYRDMPSGCFDCTNPLKCTKVYQSVEEANVVPIGRWVGALRPAGTKLEGYHRDRDWK